MKGDFHTYVREEVELFKFGSIIVVKQVMVNHSVFFAIRVYSGSRWQQYAFGKWHHIKDEAERLLRDAEALWGVLSGEDGP